MVQYISFKQEEIAGLLEKNVFKNITRADIPSNIQIFNYCFVNKVKHIGIDKAYEKSWLVIQAYNHKQKDLVLIQLPNI